jgi:hypothetical protein
MNDEFDYPHVAFSNRELNDSPPLKIGEMILCPLCGDAHVVDGGVNTKTGEVEDTILFYNCDGTSYIAGIQGKNVMRRFMK